MIPITALAAQCALQVAPKTMSAIVRVESGGNPLAMWNNTTHQRILPPNRTAAMAYLTHAMALGQKVDVGIAQVDTENFAATGLTPENAFDACANLHAGAAILTGAYRKAVAVYGPAQRALFHAFQGYNSGRLWGDAGYANAVLRAAGIPVHVQASAHMVFRHLAYVVSWTPIVKKPVAGATSGSSLGDPASAPAPAAPVHTTQTDRSGVAYVLRW